MSTELFTIEVPADLAAWLRVEAGRFARDIRQFGGPQASEYTCTTEEHIAMLLKLFFIKGAALDAIREMNHDAELSILHQRPAPRH